jgi:triosephosphate isomerase
MAYRKKIVAGNWKMNKSATEAKVLVRDFLHEIKKFDETEIILCPPFTSLAAVSELLNEVPNVRLGAQNLHPKPHGAYTGEISAGMLRDLYCRYVIVGHSERRQYFGETDELIKEKTKAALDASLKPIVCIGETLAEHEGNEWKKVLGRQVEKGIAGLSEKQIEDVIIAYEPIWAIGTGKNATPAYAQDVHAYIRGLIAKFYSTAVAAKIRIQYGGSVKPENAKELLHEPDIDGALVGGASLDARGFAAIVLASAR